MIRGSSRSAGGNAILALAAAWVVACDGAPPPPPAIPSEHRGPVANRFSAEVYPILEAKCLDCHHSDVSPPWYAVLPVVGPQIRRDVDWGRQRLDLALPYPFNDGDEVGPSGYLHGLRAATLDDSMPPRLYLFTHPTAGLTAEDRETIVGWAELAIAEAEAAEAEAELAERAAALLRNRCARCHRSEVHDDMNGGFDYAWDVEFLAEDEDYVVAEDPEGSPLFERLIDEADPMPPSPHDRLSEAEIALMERWIEEGAEVP